jgi:antitoxin component YwqK of YwqJK toxin-antitoxin module
MFTKVAIPIFICFFAFSSCNRGADNNKQIPEAYPNGKRFYVESKLKKSNSDSTTTLKFYHPNGVLSEKQDLDENDLLLSRILYDEEGLLLQTIDYSHFYDGEYDILHHTFSGNGLKWQDINYN